MLDFIHEAFIQSFYAVGNSDPNPPVGAVIVNENNRIIGKGHTQPYGGPHAEVMAIEDAEKKVSPDELSSSTLYVTLEPCSHFGKTPPCTDLIIKKNIKKVIIASPDLTEKVKGIQVLNQNQINTTLVDIKKYKEELFWTIDSFNHYQEFKKPRLWLKWAQTANGFLGPLMGKSGPITIEKSKDSLYRFRKIFNGILVTPGTVREDLPLLTPRFKKGSFTYNLKNNTLESILNIFNENYPEEYKKNHKRFIMLPEISIGKEEIFEKYIEKQKNLPGKSYFFYSDKNNDNLPAAIKDELQFIDYNKPVDIVNYAYTEGCLNLLIESGAIYSEFLLKKIFVDYLMVYKSHKKLWNEGKSFSLSEEIARKNILDKKKYQILIDEKLDEDDFYIFKNLKSQ